MRNIKTLYINSDMPGSRACALEPLLYVCGTDYIKKDIGKKKMLLMSQGFRWSHGQKHSNAFGTTLHWFSCIVSPSNSIDLKNGILVH